MIHKFSSAAAMQKFAAGLAKKIINRGSENRARIVGLVGDLGAGKTTFVQGFARELGIKKHLPSPTFLIMRNYRVKAGDYKMLWHMDAYRLKDANELAVLDFQDILEDKHNIVIIEWADKIKKILPKDAIWLNFTHGRKENERTIAD